MALALQTGVGNGSFAGRLSATVANGNASDSDVFVLQVRRVAPCHSVCVL